MGQSRRRQKRRERETGGDAARLCISPGDASVTLGSLQQLLLGVLTSHPPILPAWATVSRLPLIRGAVLCFAPGMAEMVEEAKLASDPDASGAWTLTRELAIPRVDQARLLVVIGSELLLVKTNKRKAEAVRGTERSRVGLASSSNPVDGELSAPDGGKWRVDYVKSFALSPLELLQNGYPGGSAGASMPAKGSKASSMNATHDCSAYVRTDAVGKPSGGGSNEDGSAKLLAVDCEMCWAQRADGEDFLQLARVSAVDSDLNKVLASSPALPVDAMTTCAAGVR